MEVKGEYTIPSCFPEEVMLRFFEDLSPSELSQTGLVSKQWQRLHQDDLLWRRFFHEKGSKNQEISQKHLCKRLFQNFKNMKLESHEAYPETYLLSQKVAIRSIFIHSELLGKLEAHINGLLSKVRFRRSYLAVQYDPNFIAHFDKLYYLENPEDRFELALKLADLDPAISIHIGKFNLDEKSRLEVCLKAIRMFGEEAAKHVGTFELSKESQLEVAHKLASVNPKALMENIRKFNLFKNNDEALRTELGCEAAKNEPVIVTLHISKLHLQEVDRKKVAREALRVDFKKVLSLLYCYNITEAKKFAEEVKKSIKSENRKEIGKKVKKFFHI